MNTTAKCNKNKNLSIIAAVFMGFSVLFGLQGCNSSGGGGGAVVNADPTGYYNAGGATIKDPANPVNDLVLTDLQALVSGNRIMIMSINAVLMYDVTITSITGNGFKGDVKIYYGMDTDPNIINPPFPTPIVSTISGTINEGSGITGTIEGTGIGTGAFSLTYSQTNSTLADSANIEQSTNVWNGAINGQTSMSFTFNLDSAGNLTDIFGRQPADLVFETCRLGGSITPISNEAIFAISLDPTSCAINTPEGNHSGFAITKDSNHDTLIVMFASGTVSGIGELTIIP